MYRDYTTLELAETVSRCRPEIVLPHQSKFQTRKVEHFDGQAKYDPNHFGGRAQWYRVRHRLGSRRIDRVDVLILSHHLMTLML